MDNGRNCLQVADVVPPHDAIETEPKPRLDRGDLESVVVVVIGLPFSSRFLAPI